ncbi:hypothetical protein NDU88_002926, partial [Pleurodeles waltl]
LLYLYDTMLISHTLIALRCLVSKLIQFMMDLGLSTNFTKSHIMTCGPKHMSMHTLTLGNNKLDCVSCFPYLVFNFDSLGSWSSNILNRQMMLNHSVGALLNILQPIG